MKKEQQLLDKIHIHTPHSETHHSFIWGRDLINSVLMTENISSKKKTSLQNKMLLDFVFLLGHKNDP